MSAPAVAPARIPPTQTARGGSMPGSLLSAAAAAALALACLPASVLFSDSGWVGHALLAILVVCAVGAALRRLPIPLLAVPAAQTAAFAIVTAYTLGTGSGGVWERLTGFRDLVAAGAGAVRSTAAPVASSPEFVALVVVAVFLFALALETLAVGLGLAGMSGLVLLAMAAVPLGFRAGAPALLVLAGPALGWLLLMAADQAARIRALGEPPSAAFVGSALGVLGLAAAGLVCSAVVVATIAPAASTTPWLLGRWGPTGADHNWAGATALDPFVDVRSQLGGRSSREVLRYTSTDGTATYLRLVTLEQFDGGRWSPYEPAPDWGAPLIDRDTVGAEPGPTFRVTVGALDNPYLPIPEQSSALHLSTSGDWARDSNTGDVVGSRTLATGQSYRAETVDASPDASSLARATSQAAPPSGAALDLPAQMPPQVAAMAADVTAGADSSYARAVALQSWFTHTGGFRYSLSVPDPGTRNPLVAFLDDRQGFCQQYATAMAAMARALEIPARVVVGFTGGSKAGDGTFVVTGADAHAWPELWFDDIGWVRFEPTPAAGSTSVSPPAYSAPEAGSSPSEDPAGRPSASAAPEQPSASAGPPPDSAVAGSGSLRALGAAFIAGLIVVGGLLPALIRRRLRRRRLLLAAGGDAAAAWGEVEASAIDAGLDWPSAGTVRQQADSLGTAGAAQDVRALAAVVEQHLYSSTGTARAGTGAASVIILEEPVGPTGAPDMLAQASDVVQTLDRLPRPPLARVVPRSLRPRYLRR